MGRHLRVHLADDALEFDNERDAVTFATWIRTSNAATNVEVVWADLPSGAPERTTP